MADRDTARPDVLQRPFYLSFINHADAVPSSTLRVNRAQRVGNACPKVFPVHDGVKLRGPTQIAQTLVRARIHNVYGRLLA